MPTCRAQISIVDNIGCSALKILIPFFQGHPSKGCCQPRGGLAGKAYLQRIQEACRLKDWQDWLFSLLYSQSAIVFSVPWRPGWQGGSAGDSRGSCVRADVVLAAVPMSGANFWEEPGNQHSCHHEAHCDGSPIEVGTRHWQLCRQAQAELHRTPSFHASGKLPTEPPKFSLMCPKFHLNSMSPCQIILEV